MRGTYDGIRHLSRPASRHPKMHRQDRAKLFMPFAALSGFEDSTHARERILVPRVILTDYARECLDRKLRMLQPGDYVTVVYFLPEQVTPEGALGEYRTVTSLYRRTDELEGQLLLDGARIPLEDVIELTGEELARAEAGYAGAQ